MRFKAVTGRRLNEPVQSYINNCKSDLHLFKDVLKRTLKPDKLHSRKDLLLQQPVIHWLDNTFNLNVVIIAYLYINNLQCVYDTHSGYCYYAVPDTVRCSHSKTSLNVVIRVLEFGTTDMMPLYWLRPAYNSFRKTILQETNKRI